MVRTFVDGLKAWFKSGKDAEVRTRTPINGAGRGTFDRTGSGDLDRAAPQIVEGFFDDPADPALIDAMPTELGVALPADYLDFLRRYNGGEGEFGEHNIIFWKAEELGPLNSGYEVDTYAPGMFLFGTSGGGEAFAFDLTDPQKPIVMIYFIGMDREDAIFLADSFPSSAAEAMRNPLAGILRSIRSTQST